MSTSRPHEVYRTSPAPTPASTCGIELQLPTHGLDKQATTTGRLRRACGTHGHCEAIFCPSNSFVSATYLPSCSCAAR
jgi:hypothetical protein